MEEEKLQEVEKTPPPPSKNKLRRYIIGIVFILFGIGKMLYEAFDINIERYIRFKYLFPISLIIAGVVLVLVYLFHRKKIKS